MLISAKGELIGKYRKTHIPASSSPLMNSDEKYYFKPGDSLPVFELNGLKIGMLICFDRSFPETFRTLALKGAQVVFVPVCSWGFRGDAFQTELQTRALENQIFIVAVNKAGFEQVEGEDGGREHFGRSCIISPLGQIEASIDAEPWGIVAGEIDLEQRTIMKESLMDFLRERRPELYEGLSE
jgi:N-carbamoylputrescine amidase